MNSEAFREWAKRCGDTLNEALVEAAAQKYSFLGAEALFIALASSPAGAIQNMLRSCGIDAEAACGVIRREAGIGKGENVAYSLTPRLEAILHIAGDVAL